MGERRSGGAYAQSDVLAVTMFFSSVSMAGQIIGEIKNREFGLHNLTHSPHFYCEKFDQDKDGKYELVRLTMNLRNPIGEGVGILANAFISNEFTDDPTARTCDVIDAIEESLDMTFGALYGSYDSVLRLEDGVLVEEIVVTPHASRPLPPNLPVVRLKATVKKEIR